MIFADENMYAFVWLLFIVDVNGLTPLRRPCLASAVHLGAYLEDDPDEVK